MSSDYISDNASTIQEAIVEWAADYVVRNNVCITIYKSNKSGLYLTIIDGETHAIWGKYCRKEREYDLWIQPGGIIDGQPVSRYTFGKVFLKLDAGLNAVLPP